MSKLDLLKIQNEEEAKNSYYRSPKQTPKLSLKGTYLEVRTLDTTINLRKIDEVILYIIADFKFAPLWLIKQWCADFNQDGYRLAEGWISTGLVWIESSAIGLFLRPTKLLLDIFNIEDTRYTNIPFNLLNHTCSEEQLVFDIMMGNEKSEMWQIIKNEDIIPCFHPLNIELEKESGTVAIREGNYRINRYNEDLLLEKEERLKAEINLGQSRFTSEFEDFSLFPIVNIRDNKVTTQTPDVIVPVPRDGKLPQSYAIELELSSKTPDRYENIMLNYKDNIKFGKLFYLCASAGIANKVKEAFNKVEGLGTCRLYLLSFTPPAMKIDDFSANDDRAQSNLLKLNI